MVRAWEDDAGDDVLQAAGNVATVEEIGKLLRGLRRRDGRRRRQSELTYRELSARTGWAHGIIGDYFSGKRLPPTDRFDDLVRLLGASPAEQGALATARDRVEEKQRRVRSRRTGSTTPRELPRDVAMFTGRDDELTKLDLQLTRTDRAAMAVVSGAAGVGKTAFIVHWAHRVQARFPTDIFTSTCGGMPPALRSARSTRWPGSCARSESRPSRSRSRWTKRQRCIAASWPAGACWY